MSPAEQLPNYVDCHSAFARIRAEGGPYWHCTHPHRVFELAAQQADVAIACERMAAYRLQGRKPPIAHYDATINALYVAIRLLEKERADDHGNAEWSLLGPDPSPYREPKTLTP